MTYRSNGGRYPAIARLDGAKHDLVLLSLDVLESQAPIAARDDLQRGLLG